MNQNVLDAVLKVLKDRIHLSYYPQIIEAGHLFVAYDPWALGTKFNGVRLVTAYADAPWSYHPKWVDEETVKMISLIISESLQPEEFSIWNTGLVTVSR